MEEYKTIAKIELYYYAYFQAYTQAEEARAAADQALGFAEVAVDLAEAENEALVKDLQILEESEARATKRAKIFKYIAVGASVVAGGFAVWGVAK